MDAPEVDEVAAVAVAAEVDKWRARRREMEEDMC